MKMDTELVAMLSKAQLQPITTYPVAIWLDWYCPSRRKDPDNISAAKKFLLDGLVLAGILKGDAWKYVSEIHDRFWVDAQDPRIEITIQKPCNY